ncbi:MAG: hypothetical protein KF784_12555 [Fimbriimonadaceae bacterium]|nr:hypothetical protein [Fimbriimonadaceae bacterium]
MDSMHYLTVQDVLWINYQVTKKVQTFAYAKLEEATFYQYGYGASKNLRGQAARFIEGFLKMAPLEAGNEATAFIGLLAFVRMNGHNLKLSDAQGADWLKAIASGQTKAIDALESAISQSTDGHHGLQPDAHAICEAIIEEFPQTIASLTPTNVV